MPLDVPPTTNEGTHRDRKKTMKFVKKFNTDQCNYIPKILPRSQDAKPVIVESTGLYGIKAKTLKKIKCRIGKKPYFYEIDDYESLDIDNKKDIEYLKYQVSNKK